MVLHIGGTSFKFIESCQYMIIEEIPDNGRYILDLKILIH